MIRALCLLVLVACGGGGADTDADANAFGGNDVCGGGGPLPDLSAGLDEDACTTALYYEDVPMATAYWIGAFAIDDADQVTGTETWALFANERWAELGGYDCEIVWTVSGTRHAAFQNGTYGLTLTATVDESCTDCPEDESGTPIYVGDTVMTLEYDVVDNSDGTSTVLFAGSGEVLGTGNIDAANVTYVTDHSCLAF